MSGDNSLGGLGASIAGVNLWAEFKCHFCQLSFRSRDELAVHTEFHLNCDPSLNIVVTTVPKVEESFSCSHCLKEFLSKDKLRVHEKQMTCRRFPFQCWVEDCNLQFSQLCHLKNHRLFCLDPRNLECHQCNGKFYSQTALDTHIEQRHSQEERKKFGCKLCPRSFTVKKYLNLHLKFHSIKKRADDICTYQGCGKSIPVTEKMIDHLTAYHPMPAVTETLSFQCAHCSNSFPSKLEMLLHRVECEQKFAKAIPDIFPCLSCGRVFSAKRFLDNHTDICSKGVTKRQLKHLKETVGLDGPKSKTPFMCDNPSCWKIIINFEDLVKHLETHKSSPYICGVANCQAGFTKKDNYFLHYRAVHNSRAVSLMSCPKCDEEFSHDKYLKKHLEEHKSTDKIKDHLLTCSPQKASNTGATHGCKMEGCGQSFGSMDELRQHYIRHNVSLRICSKCNKCFRDLDSVREHCLTDHKMTLLREEKCPMCDAEFTLKRHLNAHVAERHPRPWKCKECKTVMKSLLESGQHRSEHEVKECDKCGVSLSCAKALLQHILIHHKKSHSCPVQSCRAHFATVDHFERHLLGHQKDKIFMCVKCEYHCYNMRQLERHLESGHKLSPKPSQFTAEEESKCRHPGCVEVFMEEFQLVQHEINSHSDSKKDTPAAAIVVPGKRTRSQRDSIDIISERSSDQAHVSGKRLFSHSSGPEDGAVKKRRRTKFNVVHPELGKLKVESEVAEKAFLEAGKWKVKLDMSAAHPKPNKSRKPAKKGAKGGVTEGQERHARQSSKAFWDHAAEEKEDVPMSDEHSLVEDALSVVTVEGSGSTTVSSSACIVEEDVDSDIIMEDSNVQVEVVTILQENEVLEMTSPSQSSNNVLVASIAQNVGCNEILMEEIPLTAFDEPICLVEETDNEETGLVAGYGSEVVLGLSSNDLGGEVFLDSTEHACNELASEVTIDSAGQTKKEKACEITLHLADHSSVDFISEHTLDSESQSDDEQVEEITDDHGEQSTNKIFYKSTEDAEDHYENPAEDHEKQSGDQFEDQLVEEVIVESNDFGNDYSTSEIFVDTIHSSNCELANEITVESTDYQEDEFDEHLNKSINVASRNDLRDTINAIDSVDSADRNVANPHKQLGLSSLDKGIEILPKPDSKVLAIKNASMSVSTVSPSNSTSDLETHILRRVYNEGQDFNGPGSNLDKRDIESQHVTGKVLDDSDKTENGSRQPNLSLSTHEITNDSVDGDRALAADNPTDAISCQQDDEIAHFDQSTKSRQENLESQQESISSLDLIKDITLTEPTQSAMDLESNSETKVDEKPSSNKVISECSHPISDEKDVEVVCTTSARNEVTNSKPVGHGDIESITDVGSPMPESKGDAKDAKINPDVNHDFGNNPCQNPAKRTDVHLKQFINEPAVKTNESHEFENSPSNFHSETDIQNSSTGQISKVPTTCTTVAEKTEKMSSDFISHNRDSKTTTGLIITKPFNRSSTDSREESLIQTSPNAKVQTKNKERTKRKENEGSSIKLAPVANKDNQVNTSQGTFLSEKDNKSPSKLTLDSRMESQINASRETGATFENMESSTTPPVDLSEDNQSRSKVQKVTEDSTDHARDVQSVEITARSIISDDSHEPTPTDIVVTNISTDSIDKDITPLMIRGDDPDLCQQSKSSSKPISIRAEPRPNSISANSKSESSRTIAASQKNYDTDSLGFPMTSDTSARTASSSRPCDKDEKTDSAPKKTFKEEQVLSSSDRPETSKDASPSKDYNAVINQGRRPELGDFMRSFGITTNHILNLTIPEKLVGKGNEIGKGLAIDLLHASSENNIENITLARFLYAMLKSEDKAAVGELTLDAANKLANSILKLKIQSARFRARYRQLPQFLNRFLVEKFAPFGN